MSKKKHCGLILLIIVIIVILLLIFLKPGVLKEGYRQAYPLQCAPEGVFNGPAPQNPLFTMSREVSQLQRGKCSGSALFNPYLVNVRTQST